MELFEVKWKGNGVECIQINIKARMKNLNNNFNTKCEDLMLSQKKDP